MQVAAARGGTPAPRTLLPAHCPAPGRPAGSLPPRMHACAADHWLCGSVALWLSGSPALRLAGSPARRGAALLAAWRVMRDHEVKSGASRARGAGGASIGVQWFATTRARRRATTRRSLSLSLALALSLRLSVAPCLWPPLCLYRMALLALSLRLSLALLCGLCGHRGHLRVAAVGLGAGFMMAQVRGIAPWRMVAWPSGLRRWL